MGRDEISRHPERASQDRQQLYRLLDEEMVGTLSAVVEGEPWSIPIFFVRDGDTVLLHGSTGAGLLRHCSSGVPVTLTVFAIDAYVLAATGSGSSANYRSAVIRGQLSPLDKKDKQRAMQVVLNALAPGRMEEVREHSAKELAGTTVLMLPLDDFLFKARTGAAPAPEDGDSGWFGIIPVHRSAGEPITDPRCEHEVPESVHRLRSRLTRPTP
ncbi:Pyridoxamine 5'-phosphate oxidase [Corynebacterium ciconiae DSM 44920]|uniref:pyridoxamine 5'-phosphate oxidase family protein n=1 Tax=Corynebacterium ciconiae TaxID=227319 RepID=UPI0003A2B9C8|nr:pyridoxamine 5'-phosphate oxidase family protein [Corynebacterium ciconiae]WKD61397.1 Pyridoxamine 5'-phosphate oxidase [Corynebacterium ciconiae DSM 44920]